MIVRRYGARVHSVVPNFEGVAMTEVGFQRDGVYSAAAEEFEASHERVAGRELAARAEGGVQAEVEHAALEHLREQLEGLRAEVGEGHVLMIESEPGKDHPRTRYRQTTHAHRGENRHTFVCSIDPPLRVGIYRRTDS